MFDVFFDIALGVLIGLLLISGYIIFKAIMDVMKAMEDFFKLFFNGFNKF